MRSHAIRLCVIVAGVIALAAPIASAQDEAPLRIVFFDVGQGDAVAIIAPDGRTVLYDGGPPSTDMPALLERQKVASVALVIASHNHADHIGGLPRVFERYRPAYYLENGIPHTTRAYERLLLAVRAAGSLRLEPTRRTISLGEARLHVLPPIGPSRRGQNDNSVGVIVEYGAFRASLLGDSEPRQQRWWSSNHDDLLSAVAVHKSSHHGSRAGDVREVIQRLRPAIVVIGVGARNSYGHPAAETLAIYRAICARVYRTDHHGTVTVSVWSDGRFEVATARQPATGGMEVRPAPECHRAAY
ncbi:MAG TPA: MBL fold metallo-hydrolase [Gemmatimonadaceae bacterium]|nr:MBL fold metallo-hydrolase [Gemmatimonadaceae bacterium]